MDAGLANFKNLCLDLELFETELRAHKAGRPDIPWYPHDTLNNLRHLAPLITPELDDLFRGGRRFADVGGADGDLAYYLESRGNSADLIDFGPTNFNNLRGVRAMRELRSSSLAIHEVDLDAQFHIDGQYDLIFFMGILYHLKNPFYALEHLALHTRYATLSTRVARRFKAGGPDVASHSAAYLVSPQESNNDATNYWIFTQLGLARLLDRCGWDVVSWRRVGSEDSNPQDGDHDERVFCAIRSRTVAG